MQIVRCNVCGDWLGPEDDIEIKHSQDAGEYEVCPACGESGGLMDLDHGSNFDEEEVRKLWSLLEDVPMNPETEQLEDDFLGFPEGTDRETVWHWFDEHYPGGVHSLLYAGGNAQQMGHEEFMDYVRRTFNVDGATQRMMDNILYYVEKLPEDDQYAALTELLDGTIGLSDAEIRRISL